MRRIRAYAAAGILAGVAAGAFTAAVIPQTSDGTAPPVSTRDPAVAPAIARVLRVAPARTVPTGAGFVRLRATGPVRIAARLPDPRGGPDWVIRSFLAERLAPDDPGRPGSGHVIGRNRCVQLGRQHDGRFGWLTADGTFRPAGISLLAVPTQCLSRRPDLAGHPQAQVPTTITDPRRPAAAPLQNIVWGLAGPAASEPRLCAGGSSKPLRLGTAGAILAVLTPDVDPLDVALNVRYRQRGVVAVLPVKRSPLPPGLQIARPDEGVKSQLAARAPDPDGGLPYGMTATRTPDGQYCTTAGGRVVGERLGRPDYDLDTFTVGNFGAGQCPASRARQKQLRLPRGKTYPPFNTSTSTGGGLGFEPGEDPANGRVERRTPRGRVVVRGTADADVDVDVDVDTLTFAAPSDVRTIKPEGPAHAFLIVYGGDFPTGNMIVTTRFRDGRIRHDSFPVGL